MQKSAVLWMGLCLAIAIAAGPQKVDQMIATIGRQALAEVAQKANVDSVKPQGRLQLAVRCSDGGDHGC